MWATADAVDKRHSCIREKKVGIEHSYPIVDHRTVAFCVIGAMAVLLIPIMGLARLFALAIGMALGYGVIDRLARAVA